MARPRTPTKLHEIRGTGKKHPERMRDRAGEPVPTAGIGPPPAHMPEGERAIWDEIVGIMPPGVIGNMDRIALEAFVGLVSDYRECRKEGKEFASARMTVLRSLMGSFGLTPSDRSKISVPKGKGGNRFEDI